MQSGKGLLRVMSCKTDGIADMVPVDMVNNCMVSIGWMTALRPSPQPLIYQYTSGTVNPFTWSDLCKHQSNSDYISKVYSGASYYGLSHQRTINLYVKDTPGY